MLDDYPDVVEMISIEWLDIPPKDEGGDPKNTFTSENN